MPVVTFKARVTVGATGYPISQAEGVNVQFDDTQISSGYNEHKLRGTILSFLDSTSSFSTSGGVGGAYQANSVGYCVVTISQ